MVRGVGRGIARLEAVDERMVDKQYTRDLLFYSVFNLVNRVVWRIHFHQHQGLPRIKDSQERFVGRGENGDAIYERGIGIMSAV